MILAGPKFKLFNFVGAPVRLSLLFFLLLPIVHFKVETFLSVFVAILVHEMAHALVAHRKGYTVYGIDIDLFAGAAALDANMHQRDSMHVSLAGPLSNLIMVCLSLVLIPYVPYMTTFFEVNLFLFVFNMLPIYPMDGGMAFKDFLMLRMRDRRRAVEIAAMTSLTFCVFGFIASLLAGSLLLAIFFAIFFYQTVKSAGCVK